MEIASGVRAHCGPDFLLGVRVSPERFGMQLDEVLNTCQQLIDLDLTDFFGYFALGQFQTPGRSDPSASIAHGPFCAVEPR